MKYNVFISYSTKDLDAVKKIQPILDDTDDINVFVAEDSVRPGEVLDKKIEKAIKNSHLFILFWSKYSKESEWVGQEIGIAKHAEKDILPIILDKDLSAPGFISDLKFLSVHEDFDQTIKQIHEEVQIRAHKFKKVSGYVFTGLAAAIIFVLMGAD